MNGKYNLKLAACIFIMILTFPIAASAGLVERDGHKRARIAECFNDSAAQLLLLQFDSPFRDIGATPPAWQTLMSATPQDIANLDDTLVISAYDMIVTGDMEYAKKLEERGVVRQITPVWNERIILVGPIDRTGEMSGLSAGDILKKVHAGGDLFFSLLTDKRSIEVESELWRTAGVDYPQDGKGYVETGRDPVSALMQVGDERGFMLVGEASFALYIDAERFEPSITKMADTEYFRTSAACLLENSGFRKDRAADARKYIEWFTGADAEKIITSFSIGGINPFSSVK
ncbi:MAG: hypothetical protein LBT23_03660 [Synergistaceae bacterium]|nr:hypothetical protein [Synergistaceae bacterium]